MKDEKGNLVAVTLFESYLSKFLIENQGFFEPVHLKILSGIERLCLYNENNEPFKRALFAVFSLLRMHHPEVTSIDYLKNNFDLFLHNPLFIKLFFDTIIKNKRIVINYPPLERDSSWIPKLSILCQHTLFENREKSLKEIHLYLRPPTLFSPNERGASEINSQKVIRTKKLGITTLAYTPANLLNYFPKSHEPSQFEYIPNLKSNVGRWFARHNLPIITGTSGSSQDYLKLLFLITPLTPREIQLFQLSCAAVFVARGHHSYFEVMILLDRFGFKLKSTNNLFEFYEQTLPKSIIQTEEYQSFKNSEHGSTLIDKITDYRGDRSKKCRDLPHLFIDNEFHPKSLGSIKEEMVYDNRLNCSV